jgi:inositol phosphorylceramide mannosyltransferase catalytic subunit
MFLLPRTFHRIWLGNRPMPPEFVQFGNSWLAHHPSWTMHTWTDAFVPRLLNAEAFQRSTAFSGKANVLRYEILLRHGGVYIDTDFECLKNIEPLLDGVSCFVAEQSPGFANNAIIGSIAGHAFLRDLVSNLPQRVQRFSRLRSIKQSGPYYLTERLQGRSDVAVFPAKWFYPYQWHERWRRYERFTEAYAVHHWSLSWRKPAQSRPGFTQPKVSVVIINVAADVQRLEWVLEGLCEQTAPATFDVIIMDHTRAQCIKELLNRYTDRLRSYYVAANLPQRGLLSEEVRCCVGYCQAPRVILLDSHCIPEPFLVEEHARCGDGVVAFSSQRLYPRQKMFPFTPPLDYDALRMHSTPDPRYRVPGNRASTNTWRDVPECCISMPKFALACLPLPPGLALAEGGRWLARELSSHGHELVMLPRQACVTRLTT